MPKATNELTDTMVRAIQARAILVANEACDEGQRVALATVSSIVGLTVRRLCRGDKAAALTMLIWLFEALADFPFFDDAPDDDEASS